MKWILAVVVTAKAVLLNPDKDAEVLFLIDAGSHTDYLHRARSHVADQLIKLSTRYSFTNYKLKFGADAFGTFDADCYEEIVPFTEDVWKVIDVLSDPPHYNVVSGVDQSQRNTWNAIRHAVSAYKWHRDKYTRRVVVVVSDHVGGFGRGNSAPPALKPVCNEDVATAKEVQLSVQRTGTAIFHLVIDSLPWPARTRVIAEAYARTNLTDLVVQQTWEGIDINPISDKLAMLLSREWTASTTTTIMNDYVPTKITPVGDTQIWFLYDVASNGPIEELAQATANRLDNLFRDFDEDPAYVLSVDASTFGAIDDTASLKGSGGQSKAEGFHGSSWQPLTNVTTNYHPVRETMVNPRRYDQGSTAERDTWYNAIYSATWRFQERRRLARTLVVVFTDRLGSFGDWWDDDEVGDLVCALCPTSDLVADNLASTRTGLLIVLLGGSGDAVSRHVRDLAVHRYFDIQVHVLDTWWSDIDMKIRNMIQKPWIDHVAARRKAAPPPPTSPPQDTTLTTAP